jgi:hypothetical protein
MLYASSRRLRESGAVPEEDPMYSTQSRHRGDAQRKRYDRQDEWWDGGREDSGRREYNWVKKGVGGRRRRPVRGYGGY